MNYAKAIKHGMELKGYRTQIQLTEASELTREYADEVRARIAANLRAGRKG